MSERLFDVEPAFQPWQRSGVPLTDPATNTLGAVHEFAGDTERAAAALVAPRTGSWRARILDQLSLAGEDGRTAYELQSELSDHHYTIPPRLTELHNAGWIVAAEQPRPTPSGADATVWVLSPRGREALS